MRPSILHKTCKGGISSDAHPLWPVVLMVLATFAFPIQMFAQAIFEYALKSASGTLSQITSSRIAGCNIDSGLFACLSRAYPWTTVIVAAMIVLLIVRWLAAISSNNAR